MNAIQTKPQLFIFDKDGTLCPGVQGAGGKTHAPNHLDEQEYFPDVTLKCAELKVAGHVLAVASNQGGVAFGIFPADEAELLVKAAAEYIGAAAYRVCFYHPKGNVAPYNAESYNRKPNPGMLEALMQELGFAPAQTVMVGDWESDRQAADAAGCEFRYAHEFFGRVNPFADRLHSVLGAQE